MYLQINKGNSGLNIVNDFNMLMNLNLTNLIKKTYF